MSATDAKKDNLPKSALELLEEDDEFEVPLRPASNNLGATSRS